MEYRKQDEIASRCLNNKYPCYKCKKYKGEHACGVSVCEKWDRWFSIAWTRTCNSITNLSESESKRVLLKFGKNN